MDQQMFHQVTAVPKPDITAEVFRSTYPDVSLQPVEKNTSDSVKTSNVKYVPVTGKTSIVQHVPVTNKASNVQHVQVAGKASIVQHVQVASKGVKEDEEEEGSVSGGNVQYVQSQQVQTVPLIYQTQQAVLPKAVQLSIPVQTAHQIPQQYRLEQNGVIIQPQQLVYTRYTSGNNQVILQPENQSHTLQTVVVSNAVTEPSSPARMEEEVMEGKQTINCSIQCVSSPKKSKLNTWTNQQQAQEKTKGPTVIPSSSVAAVAKTKRSPQKKSKKQEELIFKVPNEVKSKVRNLKEKPTNVVLPMYPTTKGHVVTAQPKYQLPQASVLPVSTNTRVGQQQVATVSPLQQVASVTIPQNMISRSGSVTASDIKTQIIIIMPDKTEQCVYLNPQMTDYKIQDIVTEILHGNIGQPRDRQLGHEDQLCIEGVSHQNRNSNNIRIDVKTDDGSDEDLDEENQREGSEMYSNDMDDTLSLSSQECQDEESPIESTEQLTAVENHLKENTEQPIYRNGLVAICNFCGYSSVDFFKCERCNRKFKSNVKSIPESSSILVDRNQKYSRKMKSDEPSASGSPKKKTKGGCRKRRHEEPVCLTISDDEEGDADSDLSQDSSKLVNKVEHVFLTDHAANLSASEKEPVITEETNNEEGANTPEADVENCSEEELAEKGTTIKCRTVRIGSYKVVPNEEVLLSPSGIKIQVPALNGVPVTLIIYFHEIVRVLISFQKSMPVLFFYTKATAATRIRGILKMVNKDHFYFDPTSTVEVHRRITLLPDDMDEGKKTFLKQLYGSSSTHKSLLLELNTKEANEILVRASPKDVQETINKRNSSIGPSSQTTSFLTGIHMIMVYPPPPIKGGIPINTEDYACLGEDQFLNDVIIDFYLKYLLTQLSEVDQARTHVFSSFFYKRLTTRPPRATRRPYHPIEDDPSISAATKRHARVKSWTKAVDLFSKDFIIIPINEHCHWYLAIICFPGLTGPVRMSDNTPVNLPDKKKDESLEGDVRNVTAEVLTGKKPITIGSTTITAVVNTASNNASAMPDGGGDEEDRDEADGDDEDMESINSSDNESDDCVKSKTFTDEEEKELLARQEEKQVKKPKREKEPIKQPCILIFDSLAGGSRARVVATLRDYLRIEYKTKHKGEEQDFSKDVMKGASPKVPQQTNFTDCGLYLLQYVEAFFQMPVSDYHIPIKELQYWFPTDIVSRKRYEIQQLLHHLMEQQKIDIESLNLPDLRLKDDGMQKGHLVDYSCSEEEEELEDEEHLEEDPEEEECVEDEEYLDGLDEECIDEDGACEDGMIEDRMCEDEMGEEEMGEEEMCEDEMCEDEIGEDGIGEEEEEYMEETEEEEHCDDEELEDGEIHPDDIPEPFKQAGFDLKAVRIQKVTPMKQSPARKKQSDIK